MKHRRSSGASRRYHDRVARQYDTIYEDPYWEFHDQITWQAIRSFVPVDLSARCCDLGCGTGKWGLRLLKSGFGVTFVDHSAAMIEQVRAKLAEGSRGAADRARLIAGDIVDLAEIESDSFALTMAMGDPISICSDPARAAREMHRICKPGGIVIATADNKLAALEHYLAAGDLDGLEQFVVTGKTRWLTRDQREQFELSTFTPAELRRVFERAGFEVISLMGKTILPVRKFRALLNEHPDAGQRLLKLETALNKDASAAASAAHLQIAVRKAASAAN